MAYTGQLQRHNPFTFTPPELFSPWADRLLIELRRRLKRQGQTVVSVRRVAKLLDQHLESVAAFVLTDPRARQAQSSRCHDEVSKQMLLEAATVTQLRAALTDFDLQTGNSFATSHLVNVPSGWIDVEPFLKLATLALWKMAASKEAFGVGRATLPQTRTATTLILEGVTAATLALSIDDSTNELSREVKNLVQTNDQSATQALGAAKRRTSSRHSKAAIDGHRKLSGEIKARAIELANSRKFTRYTDAARYAQGVIERQFKRRAEERTIITWIKKADWSPTKPKG